MNCPECGVTHAPEDCLTAPECWIEMALDAWILDHPRRQMDWKDSYRDRIRKWLLEGETDWMRGGISPNSILGGFLTNYRRHHPLESH